MADDDKDHEHDFDAKDEGFDPWADLESEGTTDLGEGVSFSVEDVSLDAGLDLPASEPAAESAIAPDGADSGAAERLGSESPEEDAFVDAWLNDSSEESAGSSADQATVTPLSVFAPDDQPDQFDQSDVGETDGAAADAVWPSDPSAIEIGTGQSGVTSASDIDALGFGNDDEFAPAEEPMFGTVDTDDAADEVAGSIASFGAMEAEGEEEHPAADVIDFGAAATGAAMGAVALAGDGTSAAVAVTPSSKASGKPRKRGLLGSLLGVVFGGVLAIPVVLGMLIGLMWMGWQDTVGIRTWMPDQLAFLLPQPRSSAAAVAPVTPDFVAAPSLDALPAVDAAVAAPVADTATAADESEQTVATEEPAQAETGQTEPAQTEPAQAETALTATVASTDALAAEPAEPPVGDEAAVPMEDAPTDAAAASGADPVAISPAPASLADLAAIAPPLTPLEPALEPAQPAVLEPVAPVIPEPEPLDQGSLEAAVADAASALDAVQAVADPADPARKTLLVEWYKQLARTAHELATLEHVAADSGRPLPQTPASVADLGGRILAAPELTDDLARLARNWLSYSRRDGDGVVMPATFSGVRRVGPYWCSRVSIAEAGGATRELSVISRVEPAAAPGDAVVIMGLVMDGGVLWASDLRSAAADAEPAAAFEADSFGQPGL